MPRHYWLLLVTALFVVNETSVNWLVAIFVGGLPLIEAAERATYYFTATGFLFSVAFRVVPYLMLFTVTYYSSLKHSVEGRSALWIGLLFITVFNFMDIGICIMGYTVRCTHRQHHQWPLCLPQFTLLG